MNSALNSLHVNSCQTSSTIQMLDAIIRDIPDFFIISKVKLVG